jgi:hypothetical protein
MLTPAAPGRQLCHVRATDITVARTLGPNVVSSPVNSHPFIGNVVSMAFATTVMTALSVLPEFN